MPRRRGWEPRSHADTASFSSAVHSLGKSLPGNILSALQAPFAVIRPALSPLDNTVGQLRRHFQYNNRPASWFSQVGLVVFAPLVRREMLTFNQEILCDRLRQGLPDSAHQNIYDLQVRRPYAVGIARTQLICLPVKCSPPVSRAMATVAAEVARIAYEVHPEAHTPNSRFLVPSVPVGACKGERPDLSGVKAPPVEITLGSVALLVPRAVDGQAELVPLFAEGP